MQKFIIVLLSCISINGYATSNECSPTSTPSFGALTIQWNRDSAEQRALYYQTFNIANAYVDEQVNKLNLQPKTWGVIVDIDETTLENSWYFKQCGANITSDDEFSKYISLRQKSTAMPGAKQFTCHIKELGGIVAMISNRDGAYPGVLASTIKNLKQQGICFDQVLLTNRAGNKHPSNKNPRFEAVIHGTCNNQLMVCSNIIPAHQVIAYVGDNIQDFPVLTQKDMIKRNLNDSVYDRFGKGFFIVPNPIYGSWMNNQYK